MNHTFIEQAGKFSVSKTTRRFLYGAVLLALMLLAGCISTSSEPEIVNTQLVATAVPVVYPETFNVENGAALFVENCAPCHGDQGLGDGPSADGFSCELPIFPDRRAEVTLEDWHEIVSEGKQSQPGCIMPAWSAALNDMRPLTAEQIWDVTAYVYQMRYGVLPTEGAEILAGAATGDAIMPELGNPQWQAETSDSELITLLHRGGITGYDLDAPLSEDEQLVALSYLRGIAYEIIPEIASNPLPETTAEPGDEQDAAVSTAEPVAVATAEIEAAALQETPEPGESPAEADTTPAPTDAITETFTINGTLVNGTQDGSVPGALPLTLRMAVLSAATGQGETVYTAETTANIDGTFTFTDVPYNPAAVGLIATDYAGIKQHSSPIMPNTLSNGRLDVTFTVYQPTSDPSVLSLQGVYSLVDAVTEEGASTTYQFYEFVNTSDRIYIADASNVENFAIRLPLPRDAVLLEGQNETGEQVYFLEGTLLPGAEDSHQTPVRPANNFEVREEDGLTVAYANVIEPMPPGWIDQIMVGYGFDYSGSMEITQSFTYDVPAMDVGVFMSRGLDVESSQLTPSRTFNFQENPYRGFSLTQAPLPAGTSLTYRVFDGPQAASNTQTTQADSDQETTAFLNDNATLILGLGIFLLVAGGMFLFYDLQKTRILSQQGQGTTTADVLPVGKKALIAEIAALDEAYESGRIGEERYQKRRDALKEALRQVMEE